MVSYRVNIGNPRIKSESFDKIFFGSFSKLLAPKKLRGWNEWANFVVQKYILVQQIEGISETH